MYGKTGKDTWRGFLNHISHFICTNITEKTGKGNNVPTYAVAYSMYLVLYKWWRYYLLKDASSNDQGFLATVCGG